MIQGNHIYLDNHATTRVDPRVLKAMMPFYSEQYGNPNSAHLYGEISLEAVTKSRNDILKEFETPYSKVIFTSCATESIALVFQSFIKNNDHPKHIITQKTEHKAVLENCLELERQGWSITYLEVSQEGSVCLQALESAIQADTSMICIMEVNNEIGTINPIAEITKIAQKHNVPLMVDGAQAIGKSTRAINRQEIDFYIFSSHKIYGPKGVAGLLVNGNGYNLLHPQMLGGYQDTGIRSGTLNVAGIVGLAEAISIANSELNSELSRIQEIRQIFLDKLTTSGIDYKLNGSAEKCVPNNLNLQFSGVPNHVLQHKVFQDLSFSAGSACNGTQKSYVLRAIGLSDEEIKQSIRLGIGRFNTKEEIVQAAQIIVKAIREATS